MTPGFLLVSCTDSEFLQTPTMSAPASPQAARKPVQYLPSGSPTKQNGFRESRENVGRKPLPSIPIPPTGRMQDAPISPVRINVQSEDWPPQASSGHIEGIGKLNLDHGTYNVPQAMSSETRMGASQEVPYRPSHSNGAPSTRFQEPQVGIISSGDSTSSKSTSNEIKGKGTPKITGPEGADADKEPQEVEQSVPRLQYHHQSHHSEGGGVRGRQQSLFSSPQPNELAETGASINRHLTPTSQMARRTPAQGQRPFSAYSDMGPRGGSPGSFPNTPNLPSPRFRAPSIGSSLSFENRPLSYIDLANVQYPQAPPAAISMDNSQLRAAVGRNASLLSMNKTLAMYRNNVKKMTDVETQYAFAIFLIQCAQELGPGQEVDGPIQRKPSPKPGRRDSESPYVEAPQSSPQDLIREAKQILQKLADRGYPFAQYYLADGYSSGLFSKGKEDYSTAFPLFISASKHGHAESGYRAALCYEFGWGCRKDLAKAGQFYRQSASKNHPGAMTRLGRACLTGDLGVVQYREGLKWLNRATESADLQYNAAPYHLGMLYESGDGQDVFKDEAYAARLFTQAADLGHAEASYRLGDAYEHGKLSCPRDPALSVHFYTGAAQRGHPTAMMALCAWYMIGAEPILEKDENEAYEWARQAAELG